MRSDRLPELNELESEALVRIQSVALQLPRVQQGSRLLSHFGEHALGWLGTAAAGAAFDEKRRRQWVAMGVAAFTSHAASVVIKRIVRRRRPTDPRITVGVATPSTLSFPSSHSTSGTAALVSLAQLSRSPLPLAGIPVMMMSRMVLGVHYPSDTVLGAAIGAATAGVVHEIERRTR
ncbi:MAG TPA: phosphatase PAP2 family protein [Corynebacterium sp.]|nr:phosphatase PAP2 family protein [Corynebacterium sp.]